MRFPKVVVAVVACVSALCVALVVFCSDGPFMLTFDDSFYYFEIASNIADGHGSTFDRLNKTNGYHPLWQLISVAPFAAGAEGMTAVRVLLVLQVVFWAAAMLVLGRCVYALVEGFPRLAEDRKARMSCTVALVAAGTLLIGNPLFIRSFVNGLESGVSVVVYAALLALAVRERRSLLESSRAVRLRISLLLAIAILARTDAVLLVACVGIALIPDALAAGRRSLVRGLELFGMPALTLAVYLGVNAAWFGEPLQVSGDVKRLPLTMGRISLAIVVVALIAALALYARSLAPRARRARMPRTAVAFSSTSWFAGFCVAVIAYYEHFQADAYLWYFAPVLLYVGFLFVVLASDLLEGSIAESRPAQRKRSFAMVAGLLVVPTFVGVVMAASSFFDPNLRSIQLANRDAGIWISRSLPNDAVLASWDAGVLGYFTEQRVVNIDGVVNSHGFIEARNAGEAPELLRGDGVHWIANHGDLVDGQDPEIEGALRPLVGGGPAADVSLVRLWPFEFSGVSNSRRGSGNMAVFLYELPESFTARPTE